ncbi:arsenic resistance protein [Herbiconiux sp. CPCC 203407]|uniref:Arsenic resistance protein n=1 Tax=Herbiconiux oxytropis TaxID=2970915 RepID=A0AA41XJ47_9MICO|nr:arsenic resistance protein [Herbiconiux oxytropis]MCS5722760.1 arsenic resistance protein [Herbiconiux oxytropis]MCS5727030.1 arsenic resistance protein [Herbiconiux oxytropis]
MPGVVGWWDRRQVAVYVGAIAVGAGVGLAVGAGPAADVAGAAIEPLLMVLLFATFLGVPLAAVGHAFRDGRFLGTLLVLNFAVVPIVVFGLSRFVADDPALLIGVLLVLLTPCVDYVIAFTGLVGGDRARLLAATPLLMLAQIVLLPAYLALFSALTPGEAVAGGRAAPLEVEPFVRAFVLLIVVPLVAAAVVQVVARGARRPTPGDGVRATGPAARVAQGVIAAGAAAMVPAMAATLAVVVCSQIAAVGAEVGALARVVPLYVAFLVIMLAVGIGAGRAARLGVPRSRAVVFSGTTRNSLVVLPIALALPEGYALAPLAVVTQTLVELVGMVVFVRVVPLVVRARRAG